jgi:hypothetical protein
MAAMSKAAADTGNRDADRLLADEVIAAARRGRPGRRRH